MFYLHYVVLALFLAAFVMSVILHEVAHGWVAKQCGDPTAEAAGRLTLNPIHHIDPVFTILMPIMTWYLAGFIFGGAKPVPVNPYYYRHPETDDLKVSLAGVATNFLIALAAGYAIHLWKPGSAGHSLFTLITIANLVLAFFNLIPIPPLDGSHVARFFIARVSRELADGYEKIGMIGGGMIGFILIFALLNVLYVPIVLAVQFVWVHVLMIDNASWLQVIQTFR